MSNMNVDDSSNSSARRSNQDIFLSVMDESIVQAQVYMNNITDQEISSIKYEVFTASNNLTSNLVLIDLNRCITLAPHSSCLITFATSILEYNPI